MFCARCGCDVHPVKVLGTRRASNEEGAALATGSYYNQCPECTSQLPPDEAQVSSVPPPPPARQLPVNTPKSKPTPRKTGNVVDDARDELAATDQDIAALNAQIDQIKTEITLKKAHRKGLLAVVSAYERAARPRIQAIPVPADEPAETPS